MVDTIIHILLVFFFFKGFWAGDDHEITELFSWFLSLLVGTMMSSYWVTHFEMVGLSFQLSRVLSFAFVAIVMFPLLHTLLRIANKAIFFRLSLTPPKRILGGFLSLLRGFLLVVLTAHLLVLLPLRSNAIDNSVIVQSLAGAISPSGEPSNNDPDRGEDEK